MTAPELPTTIVLDAPPLNMKYWRWGMERLHDNDAINFERNQRKAVLRFVERFHVEPTICFVGAGWLGFAPVPEGV